MRDTYSIDIGVIMSHGACDECATYWDAVSAEGAAEIHRQARIHAKHTGHVVSVEVTRETHYQRSEG